jgi:hypothetical protein
MAHLDIFIKTYHKDFEWLFFCLSSIDKFLDGFERIIIAMPSNDRDFFSINTKQFSKIYDKIQYVYTHDYGNTYLYQQYIKMTAYQYIEADYIMYVDSDVIFNRKSHISESFNSEQKPIIYYTPYEMVGNAICWQEPTSKLLGEYQPYEFMRKNCLVFRKQTLIDIHTQYPNLQEIIMNSIRFSEFNTIGAWAFKNEFDNYSFINTTTNPPPPANHIQFWSYSNLNEKDRLRIKQILN